MSGAESASPGGDPADRANVNSGGFALVEAIVALAVAASVLAGVYQLISIAATSSARSVDMAYASAEAHQFCLEIASGALSPGKVSRETGARVLTAETSVEPRQGLPAETRLWRIECMAFRSSKGLDQSGAPALASELTYALRSARTR